HLGRRLREAATRAVADCDATDFPRRQLLFDRHAAAGLANGEPFQPRSVSDQRLPLELLRRLRCECRLELGGDGWLPRSLSRHRRPDLPDGIPAEDLNRPCFRTSVGAGLLARDLYVMLSPEREAVFAQMGRLR